MFVSRSSALPLCHPFTCCRQMSKTLDCHLAKKADFVLAASIIPSVTTTWHNLDACLVTANIVRLLGVPMYVGELIRLVLHFPDKISLYANSTPISGGPQRDNISGRVVLLTPTRVTCIHAVYIDVILIATQTSSSAMAERPRELDRRF